MRWGPASQGSSWVRMELVSTTTRLLLGWRWVEIREQPEGEEKRHEIQWFFL